MGFLLQGEQLGEQLAAGGNQERPRAVVAVHAAWVAFAVGGVAVKEESLTEFDEFFHALIAAGKQSFTRLVAVDYCTCPAAEPAVSATGRAGVYLNGAFAVAGARVQFVKRPIVTTPRIRLLEQIGPDILCGQKFNRVGYPDTGQVRVPTQAIARLTSGHRLGPG